jgi:hypothetical protein
MKKWQIALAALAIIAFIGCPNPVEDNGDENTVYEISIPSFSGGNISASPQSGIKGTVITLTIQPDTDKRLIPGSLEVKADKTGELTAVSVVPENETQYRFTMPAANVTIGAAFEDGNNDGADSNDGTDEKDDDENINTTGYLQLKTTGIKSLYVGNVSVQSGSPSLSISRALGDAGTAIQTLSYINAQ